MSKQHPILNNWCVRVVLPNGAYTPPEQAVQVLAGTCLHHPRFADGNAITTSAIKGKKGGAVVTASGSHYRLGTVDPDYEKAFPQASARLLGSLPERP